CGEATQNSAQYLMDTFGPAHLDPATVAIDAPADGTWVKPGFAVHATAMSQLSLASAELDIDGSQTSSLTKPPLAFNAPSTLGGGDHTITVSATDSGARQASASVTVHVVASCAGGQSCPSGFGCLGGLCLPNEQTPGGLGAPCTDNADGITNSRGTDVAEH